MESEKIMIKKIIAVSLSITLACLNLESVYAQGTIVEKEEQKFEENNRLDEAFMYAQDYYKKIANFVFKSQEQFQTNIDDVSDLELGEGYIIYDASKAIQESSYYFPVYENNEVVLVVNVIESNEGWNISVGTDEIEEESDGKFVGAGGITSGNGYAYLNMDNCCVGQGNYNLCWAASIATIYRYRTGNRSLTAKNVADKVGLPYAAANESEIATAFNVYGLSYKERKFIPFSKIKSNINNKYPVMVKGKIAETNKYTKHAVTVVGYNDVGVDDFVKIWDSATEKYKIIKYSENACYSSGSNIFMIQSGFSYK